MKMETYINKVVPVVLTINCFYIWITVILGTVQLFGNGLLSSIIGYPVLILNCYVHVEAYIAIKEEYKKKS